MCLIPGRTVNIENHVPSAGIERDINNTSHIVGVATRTGSWGSACLWNQAEAVPFLTALKNSGRDPTIATTSTSDRRRRAWESGPGLTGRRHHPRPRRRPPPRVCNNNTTITTPGVASFLHAFTAGCGGGRWMVGRAIRWTPIPGGDDAGRRPESSEPWKNSERRANDRRHGSSDCPTFSSSVR